MLNMLVVDDNLDFSKILINSLLQSNSNLKLCMIATDGQEALHTMNNNKIDIVLLDLKLPIYNGLEILDYLAQNHLYDYQNSIIVISGEPEMILKVRNNPLVYSYINKSSNINKIIENINELCVLKENEIKRIKTTKKEEKNIKGKILEELIYIGYNVKYDGTNYLADTIYHIYHLKRKKFPKLEKDIYPILSETYNKSVNTIKCDIIRATSQVNKSTSKLHIKKYFGSFFDTKINPKLVINAILNKIIYEM